MRNKRDCARHLRCRARSYETQETSKPKCFGLGVGHSGTEATWARTPRRARLFPTVWKMLLRLARPRQNNRTPRRRGHGAGGNGTEVGAARSVVPVLGLSASFVLVPEPQVAIREARMGAALAKQLCYIPLAYNSNKSSRFSGDDSGRPRGTALLHRHVFSC